MTKKDFRKNTAEVFISEETKQQAQDPKPQAQKTPQPAQEAGLIIPKGYKLVKENKSQRMQLLVRPAIKDAIRAEAEAQGLSMNDLVNNIFEEYLERKDKA